MSGRWEDTDPWPVHVVSCRDKNHFLGRDSRHQGSQTLLKHLFSLLHSCVCRRDSIPKERGMRERLSSPYGGECLREEEHCRQEPSPRLQPRQACGEEERGPHLSLHAAFPIIPAARAIYSERFPEFPEEPPHPFTEKRSLCLSAGYLAREQETAQPRPYDSKSRSSMPLNQITGAKGHLASRVYGTICLSFLESQRRKH